MRSSEHSVVHQLRRRRRTGLAVVVALSCSSLLAGCGAEQISDASASSAEGARVLDFEDGTVALVNEATEGYMDAMVEGTVAVVDGTSCWGVTDASGETFVVVWPHETSATDDGAALRASPEVTLRPGDKLSSGGYVTPDTVTALEVKNIGGDVNRIVLAKESSPAT